MYERLDAFSAAFPGGGVALVDEASWVNKRDWVPEGLIQMSAPVSWVPIDRRLRFRFPFSTGLTVQALSQDPPGNVLFVSKSMQRQRFWRQRLAGWTYYRMDQ